MTIAEICRRRRAGFTYREIGEQACLSRATISRICVANDAYPDEPIIWSRRPQKRVLDGREDEVRSLHWDQGLSTRQIGERFGISGTTVYNFMHARGIPTRGKAEATTLRFQGDQPPSRSRNQTTFDSERAGEVSRAYYKEKRRRDAYNARRRDRRAREKVAA